MDKHRGIASVFLIICLLFIFVLISVAEGQEGLEEKAEEKPSISQVVKSLFSASTVASTSSSYWGNVKTLIHQAQTYFFPPNIDFRVSDEAAKDPGKGLDGEKVKEALARSTEKTKATVENSAISAAKIAGKTMHKTKEKLQRSSSQSDEL